MEFSGPLKDTGYHQSTMNYQSGAKRYMPARDSSVDTRMSASYLKQLPPVRKSGQSIRSARSKADRGALGAINYGDKPWGTKEPIVWISPDQEEAAHQHHQLTKDRPKRGSMVLDMAEKQSTPPLLPPLDEDEAVKAAQVKSPRRNPRRGRPAPAVSPPPPQPRPRRERPRVPSHVVTYVRAPVTKKVGLNRSLNRKQQRFVNRRKEAREREELRQRRNMAMGFISDDQIFILKGEPSNEKEMAFYLTPDVQSYVDSAGLDEVFVIKADPNPKSKSPPPPKPTKKPEPKPKPVPELHREPTPIPEAKTEEEEIDVLLDFVSRHKWLGPNSANTSSRLLMRLLNVCCGFIHAIALFRENEVQGLTFNSPDHALAYFEEQEESILQKAVRAFLQRNPILEESITDEQLRSLASICDSNVHVYKMIHQCSHTGMKFTFAKLYKTVQQLLDMDDKSYTKILEFFKGSKIFSRPVEVQSADAESIYAFCNHDEEETVAQLKETEDCKIKVHNMLELSNYFAQLAMSSQAVLNYVQSADCKCLKPRDKANVKMTDAMYFVRRSGGEDLAIASLKTLSVHGSKFQNLREVVARQAERPPPPTPQLAIIDSEYVYKQLTTGKLNCLKKVKLTHKAVSMIIMMEGGPEATLQAFLELDQEKKVFEELGDIDRELEARTRAMEEKLLDYLIETKILHDNGMNFNEADLLHMISICHGVRHCMKYFKDYEKAKKLFLTVQELKTRIELDVMKAFLLDCNIFKAPIESVSDDEVARIIKAANGVETATSILTEAEQNRHLFKDCTSLESFVKEAIVAKRMENYKKLVDFLKDYAHFVGKDPTADEIEDFLDAGTVDDSIKLLETLGTKEDFKTLKQISDKLKLREQHIKDLVEYLGEADLFDQAEEGMDLSREKLIELIHQSATFETVIKRLQAMDLCDKKFMSLDDAIAACQKDSSQFKLLMDYFGACKLFAKKPDLDEIALTQLLALTGGGQEAIEQLKEVDAGSEFTTIAELVESLTGGDEDEGDEGGEEGTQDSSEFKLLMDYFDTCTLFANKPEQDEIALTQLLALTGGGQKAIEELKEIDDGSPQFATIAELAAEFAAALTGGDKDEGGDEDDVPTAAPTIIPLTTLGGEEGMKDDSSEFKLLMDYFDTCKLFANKPRKDEVALTQLLTLTGGGQEAIEQLKEVDDGSEQFTSIAELVDALDGGDEGDEGDEGDDEEFGVVMEYLGESSLFGDSEDVDIDEDLLSTLLEIFGGSGESAVVRLEELDREGATFASFEALIKACEK